MTRRLVLIIVAVVFAAVIAVFLAFGTRKTRTAALPTPNGYDDFTAAAQWLVMWSGDLSALSPEGKSNIVYQNSKTLETVHAGLKKESAVPVAHDMNWLNSHMVEIATHKQIAQLLVAGGLVHLEAGRTNEAARSFTDCIVFAHAAHRRGLLIDDLVGIACQAIGSRQLAQVGPGVSPDALKEILRDLIALDQERETAAAIVQRDRDWSRGIYGLLGVAWHNIAMRQGTRASELKFEKKQARAVAALRLLMTELAVRGYQLKNGKPPRTLVDLVPAWLPAVPLDPFSRQPLVYRVTTNSFQLYSVGPDGKDDQGTPLKRDATETGDLLPSSL